MNHIVHYTVYTIDLPQVDNFERIGYIITNLSA